MERQKDHLFVECRRLDHRLAAHRPLKHRGNACTAGRYKGILQDGGIRAARISPHSTRLSQDSADDKVAHRDRPALGICRHAVEVVAAWTGVEGNAWLSATFDRPRGLALPAAWWPFGFAARCLAIMGNLLTRHV
jgi:hypothetical protein